MSLKKSIASFLQMERGMDLETMVSTVDGYTPRWKRNTVQLQGAEAMDKVLSFTQQTEETKDKDSNSTVF